ncbi:hypothetical protein KAFR_0A07860 [Kazachstania africana CBS 2517]|uniref:DNA-binding protein RAP1 n=1 Tax=Kazachstania africana (strain ATCC 22294 / BCRC 22015 / CBS 2517 / CECT 1963 / NBRC 1671 / NRRL Y-8276) TaxID=1071382 RepID=H2APC0_KAZAF|nr:hypothetical protein KAFR_0A07860 [Kazachstania africana CBS 2517]CCF56220.1 hypothetical protein KAFR_0A07860 [Kazachstania africana CBS 2517]
MSDADEITKAAEDFVNSLNTEIVVDEETANGRANNAADENTTKVTAVEEVSKSVSNDSKKASGSVDTDGSENSEPLVGMKFFLNRDSDAHDSINDIEQLARLIKSNGGQILEDVPQSAKTNVVIVSPYNDTNLPTVTPTYIKACVQSKKRLDIGNYLVPYDEFRNVIDTQLVNSTTQKEEKIGTDDKTNAGEENKPNESDNEDSFHSVTDNMDPQITESNRNKEDMDKNDRQEQERLDQIRLLEQYSIMENHENGGSNNTNNANNGEVEVTSPPDANVEHASQSPNDYQSNRTMLARASLPSHNKASFTEDEDDFILDVVRKNPTRRTTHTLFDEISHYVPNHTGNSIRHRFRVYLAKRLDFVYKVDQYGKLMRDESGNLIKTTIMPPSLKKKFTADEDYTLALAVKKQFYRDLYQVDPDTGVSLISQDDSPNAIARRSLTMDSQVTPGSEPPFSTYHANDRRGPIAREFFKTFAEQNPNHTENAWRDRFRKFLLVYGIDHYIEYFEDETKAGREPEPMKNLTNRPKRPGVPTPGNYNSASKRARAYQSTTAAAAPATTTLAGASTSSQQAYTIPENELLDEETMNFISSLRNDLVRNEQQLPFEYPPDLAEEIRNDFVNETNYDNIDPDTIQFPPEIATVDLFLPTFFQLSSTREFMDKLQEVISREYDTSQAEKLVQDLAEEAGIRKTFSTTVLTALSGDLMVFPRYFLNMFKYNANPPMNVPGIWTREDDDLLRNGNRDDVKMLIQKHRSARVEMRKKFIERDLI